MDLMGYSLIMYVCDSYLNLQQIFITMEKWELIENEIKEMIPEIYIITTILLIWMYGTIWSVNVQTKSDSNFNLIKETKYPILIRTMGWLGIQILSIYGLLTMKKPELEGIQMWNGWITDEFTLWGKMLIIISAIATIAISMKYAIESKMNKNEWITIMLLGTWSTTLIITAYDLISIYLAIELQSLGFYVLAAYKRNNEYSTESGLKYFILGAISSGIILYGTALIYGMTGITNYEELTKIIIEETIRTGEFQNTHIENLTIIKGGLIFILIGLLFKMSAVPFHIWTPDVYEGAPTAVTGFFTIVPKMGIIGIMIRTVGYAFYDLIETWQNILLVSAILSMYIGTFGAIKQKKIKRLIAYSGIAHIGYMLIGIGTGTVESIEGVLIYVLGYITISISMFGILLNTSKQKKQGKTDKEWEIMNEGNGSWKYYRYLNILSDIIPSNNDYLKYIHKGNPQGIKMLDENNQEMWENKILLSKKDVKKRWNREEIETEYTKQISDWSGWNKTNPAIAVTLAIILFSNAGIPPLIGFYGKLNVFLAAVENGLYAVAISGILCSVVGAFYAIRLVKIVYYEQKIKEEKWKFYTQINKESAYIIAISTLLTLLFFMEPSLILTKTHEAALSICI